jgi:hypothetical protein
VQVPDGGDGEEEDVYVFDNVLGCGSVESRTVRRGRRGGRAYKDGRNEEKDEFADAYSIWMGAGMEDLIERYTLQASEKTVCVNQMVV